MIMTQEFFPRDPTEALHEVKEQLYYRLLFLRCEPEGCSDEIAFLEELLDKLERS